MKPARGFPASSQRLWLFGIKEYSFPFVPGRPTTLATSATLALLLLCTPFLSWAEDNTVSVNIEGPVLDTKQALDDFEDLKERLFDSVSDALRDRLDVRDNDENTRYTVTLDMKGPYFDCRWYVGCSWRETSVGKANDCWKSDAIISYCRNEDPIMQLEQIDCIGKHVKFPNEKKSSLPDDLCEVSENEGESDGHRKHKIVFSYCFDVAVYDDTKKDILANTYDAPAQLVSEFGNDLAHMGYALTGPKCTAEGLPDDKEDKPDDVHYRLQGGFTKYMGGDQLIIKLVVTPAPGIIAYDDQIMSLLALRLTVPIERDTYSRLLELIEGRIRENINAALRRRKHEY